MFGCFGAAEVKGGPFRRAGGQPRCAWTLVHTPKQLSAGDAWTLGRGGEHRKVVPARVNNSVFESIESARTPF